MTTIDATLDVHITHEPDEDISPVTYEGDAPGYVAHRVTVTVGKNTATAEVWRRVGYVAPGAHQPGEWRVLWSDGSCDGRAAIVDYVRAELRDVGADIDPQDLRSLIDEDAPDVEEPTPEDWAGLCNLCRGWGVAEAWGARALVYLDPDHATPGVILYPTSEDVRRVARILAYRRGPGRPCRVRLGEADHHPGVHLDSGGHHRAQRRHRRGGLRWACVRAPGSGCPRGPSSCITIRTGSARRWWRTRRAPSSPASPARSSSHWGASPSWTRPSTR